MNLSSEPSLPSRKDSTFYHVDFSLQALAKLERGLKRDLGDVEAMLEFDLTSAQAVRETFESIEPELYRFPAIDAEELRAVVSGFIEEHDG